MMNVPFLFLPPYFPWNPTQINSYTIDAASEKVAQLFLAPKSGNIAKVAIRTGAVAVSDTLKVSIQGAASAGYPDGSIKGGGNAYGTIASPASLTLYTVTLGTAAAVSKDDPLTIVVEFASYTSGNMTFSSYSNVINTNNGYAMAYTSSWTKSAGSLACAIEYDDGSHPWAIGINPTIAISGTFSRASTPDERGNLITMPFPCRVIGVWAILDLDTDPEIKYYGVGGEQSVSIASGRRFSTSFAHEARLLPTPEVVDKGQQVRVTVYPGASGYAGFYADYLISSAFIDALPEWGHCIGTYRTDAGAWTDQSNVRHSVGVIIDQIHDAAKPWRWRGSYGRRF